ncbi:MAG: phage terminase large subunit [Rhodospirillales bacterium]
MPDWTASVLLGFSAKAKLWFIVDVARYQLEAGDVRGEILRIAAEDEAHFPGRVKIELPQDPGQAGKDQIQNLVQMLAGYVVHKAVVQGDKGVRAEPANSQAQMQFVRYIVGDWNTAFFNEICGFPTAAHDDMFDAFTTAFNALTAASAG